MSGLIVLVRQLFAGSAATPIKFRLYDNRNRAYYFSAIYLEDPGADLDEVEQRARCRGES